MISWKLKLWRTAGVAAALSLAGCGEGGVDGDTKAAGEGSEAAAHGEAGEAAIGESGGEHGEAGVATAYAGVTGPQRTALRLQQLKGFLLIASQVAEGDTTEEAGVLVQQGLLEVYDPAVDQFAGFNPAAVRAAGDGNGVSRQQMAQRLQAGEAAINAARGQLADVNYADLVVRMTDISTGIYRSVVTSDGVDPIEYQHSLGAALAARDALVAGEATLRAQNTSAYEEALGELNRMIELWPEHSAPEQATPYRNVVAASSRVRLALSPYL